MTESKWRSCHKDSDCKDAQPCPIPLACLYGGCVCTAVFPNLSSSCQIICGQLGKKAINHHESSHCVCSDK